MKFGIFLFLFSYSIDTEMMETKSDIYIYRIHIYIVVGSVDYFFVHPIIDHTPFILKNITLRKINISFE